MRSLTALGLILISSALFTNPLRAQFAFNMHYPMSVGQEWQFTAEDYPWDVYDTIVDTTRVNGHLFYRLDLVLSTQEAWLRPENEQVYLLDLSDSTEHLLFDFAAEINSVWPIPAGYELEYGDSIRIISRMDTLHNPVRDFVRCTRFVHYNSVWDGGRSETCFSRDYGPVYFAQESESGVTDFNLVTTPLDTLMMRGVYTFVGNPCTTYPCLPGIVAAMMGDGIEFVLLINGIWSSQPISWNGVTPMLDDSIEVTAVYEEHFDIFGERYYTLDLVDLSIIQNTTDLMEPSVSFTPSQFDLHVAPNPFNGETRISFNLLQTQSLALAIFDARGRRVFDLPVGMYTAGRHTIQWSPGELPSGTYFAFIESRDEVQMTKTLLIK